MSRYLRYTLLTLLWVAVAAYIVFAASAVRRVRRTGTVGKLEIEVVDSSSQGHLVSAAMVRQWISHAGIKTLGTAVDAVDLTGIERLIARNGFVDKRLPMSPTGERCTSRSASASRWCACLPTA